MSNSGVLSERIVAAKTCGKQQWIVAEDGGKRECMANSNRLLQKLGTSANARQTVLDHCKG